MGGRKSGQTVTKSDRSNEANRRNRPQRATDMELLGQLSPSALAHWPTVAKQLSEAGVLGSVDARSVARYCEAFAQWCGAADELAKMLIELGMMSNRRTQEQATQNPTQLAATTPTTVPDRRTTNAIMRRVEVERETGLSRSTIYKRVKDGTFPPPLKIGPGATGWRVSDIEAFLAAPADYKAGADSG